MRADVDVRARTDLRILVAPNAFKGTLTAGEAAQAMARGALTAAPGATLDLAPIADGGDGSVAAFLRADFENRSTIACGPTGAPVEATYAFRDGVAVVELANSCGMALLPDGLPAPMTSSTRGLGDVMRAALDDGAREIVVCLGGSASTDGGAGMLVALGARLRDHSGAEVEPRGSTLDAVRVLDVTGLDARLASTRLVVACDVDSPLVGPRGAAAVFAPQKGAGAEQVSALERALGHWADVLRTTFGAETADVPGAGAAGGTGASLVALGAHVRPGFGLLSDLIDLPRRIARADLVITGEGRLDEQTGLGKGVGGVAALAREHGVPTLAVCGRITLGADRLRELGLVGWSDLQPSADGDSGGTRLPSQVTHATARAVEAWLRA